MISFTCSEIKLAPCPLLYSLDELTLKLVCVQTVVRLSMMLWAKRNHVFDSIRPLFSQRDDVMRFKISAAIRCGESFFPAVFAASIRLFEHALTNLWITNEATDES